MGQAAELLAGLSDLSEDELIEQAKAVVDRGDRGEPIHGPDPVNVPMVRHFLQAIGDESAVHTDEAAAVASRHGRLTSPPGMLGVWTLGVSKNSGGPRDQVLRRLEAAGFTSVVATNYSHEWIEPLVVGDRVYEVRSIEDLTGPKTTGLGEGFFVMSRYDYYREDGTLVGTARMRLLKFRPRQRTDAASAARPVAQRPRPVINRDNRFYWDGVAAGELRIQRCLGCKELRHPPGPMCPHCGSLDWDHMVAAGTGSIYATAIHHHPPLPGVDRPHAVILVELNEGVRILSETVGLQPRDVRIGLPVELTFKQIDEDLTVPAFRAADGAVSEPRPPVSADDIAVGDVVPGFVVPMTPTFIISSALATRDFEEVHHDASIARARGSEDLFPNILTSNGLALRLVTDWFGSDVVMEKADIRLGLPAYVGQDLEVSGEVTSAERRPDRGDVAVTVAVRGRMASGEHMSGTVAFSWVEQEVEA